jgi:hypothetical protein
MIHNLPVPGVAVRVAAVLGVLVGASVLGCGGSFLGGLGESQTAFWDVCQGQGVDNSAEYVDDPTTKVHKVAAVYTYVDKYLKTPEGITRPWFNLTSNVFIPYEFPGSWGADNPEEVELVVCIHEPHGSMVSDCGLYKSSGGTEVHIKKNQYSRYIELREARTGKLVASTTIQGPPPDECSQSIVYGHGTGYDVPGKPIEDWLKGYVEPKKE